MNDSGWFVYILRCADGTYYTGITNDLERRCRQHNAGTGSRYTRCRLPARVVYHEPQATRSLALKREAAVKALSRRQKEALVRTVTHPARYDRSSCRAG
jgi:predicted GIY-YIG superfamily endonuclease